MVERQNTENTYLRWVLWAWKPTRRWKGLWQTRTVCRWTRRRATSQSCRRWRWRGRRWGWAAGRPAPARKCTCWARCACDGGGRRWAPGCRCPARQRWRWWRREWARRRFRVARRTARSRCWRCDGCCSPPPPPGTTRCRRRCSGLATTRSTCLQQTMDFIVIWNVTTLRCSCTKILSVTHCAAE